MTIEVKLLKNHQDAIPALAKIWYEVLGADWIPGASHSKAEQEYADHINSDTLPLTLVAFDAGIPIGMCSLRDNDGIRPDLSPWLGSLVIDKASQGKGVGKLLMQAAIAKAESLRIKKLYLFVLNHQLVDYYVGMGWKTLNRETFKGQPVILMEKNIDDLPQNASSDKEALFCE